MQMLTIGLYTYYARLSSAAERRRQLPALASKREAASRRCRRLLQGKRCDAI